MSNPRSNPDSKPPSTEQQRAMEQAAQRAARSAQVFVVLALLVPFVAYRGFHASLASAAFLHVGFLLIALRHAGTWWACRRVLHGAERSPTGASASSGSRRDARLQGSFPSRKVRVIPSFQDDPETWTTTVQGMLRHVLLGTFDDQPVYQWVRFDDHWYRYETVDRLVDPINDNEFHLVLGGLCYLRLPDDHPDPRDAGVEETTANTPVA